MDLFKSLKQNQEEANVDRAVQIGGDTSSPQGDEDNSLQLMVHDLLLSLPGINVQNCHRVTDSVQDIAALARMSVQQLTPLLGPQNAKKLFAFFLNSA